MYLEKHPEVRATRGIKGIGPARRAAKAWHFSSLQER
jgi:hypothetical protein